MKSCKEESPFRLVVICIRITSWNITARLVASSFAKLVVLVLLSFSSFLISFIDDHKLHNVITIAEQAHKVRFRLRTSVQPVEELAQHIRDASATLEERKRYLRFELERVSIELDSNAAKLLQLQNGLAAAYKIIDGLAAEELVASADELTAITQSLNGAMPTHAPIIAPLNSNNNSPFLLSSNPNSVPERNTQFGPSSIASNLPEIIIPQFPHPTFTLVNTGSTIPTDYGISKTNILSKSSNNPSPLPPVVDLDSLPPILPLQHLLQQPIFFPLPDCLARFNAPFVESCVVNDERKLAIGHFDTLTIKSGATLSAPGWDGKRSGVLVIVARQITIERGGCLSAMGCGYWGGKGAISYGLGGVQGESWTGQGTSRAGPNAGGGGGGGSSSMLGKMTNFGVGGGGGGYSTPGINCTAHEYCLDAIDKPIGPGGQPYEPFSVSQQYQGPCVVLGSGGGGGGCPANAAGKLANGGNGGGAIIIRAHTLRNDGLICANGVGGTMRHRFAGGGGGSGGLVLIVAEHVFGRGGIEARGGLGGSPGGDVLTSHSGDDSLLGGGGNGGDGYVIIRSTNSYALREMKIACSPRGRIEENLVFPNVLSSLVL